VGVLCGHHGPVSERLKVGGEMSAIDLGTLLKLVGQLDDSADPNSASGRFRAYVQENVRRVGDLRAYVNAALSTSVL